MRQLKKGQRSKRHLLLFNLSTVVKFNLSVKLSSRFFFFFQLAAVHILLRLKAHLSLHDHQTNQLRPNRCQFSRLFLFQNQDRCLEYMEYSCIQSHHQI